jgi:hypothetical protein
VGQARDRDAGTAAGRWQPEFTGPGSGRLSTDQKPDPGGPASESAAFTFLSFKLSCPKGFSRCARCTVFPLALAQKGGRSLRVPVDMLLQWKSQARVHMI